MNPTLHYPCELELADAGAPPTLSHKELFALRLRYRPEGNWQVLLATFVPTSLHAALASGNVKAVHVETLEVNGPAARALPGLPGHLVLGVELTDGTEFVHVPAQLRWTRRKRYMAGATLCAAGLASLLCGHSWLGALALVVGTHAWRTARQVPHKAFHVCRQVS